MTFLVIEQLELVTLIITPPLTVALHRSFVGFSNEKIIILYSREKKKFGQGRQLERANKILRPNKKKVVYLQNFKNMAVVDKEI